MAKLKANQVDGFISKPDPAFDCILLYGPDQGLVLERARKLCEVLGGGSAEVIRFDADELVGETGRLAEEAFSISMFGGHRILRISGSTRKNLVAATVPLFETRLTDCHVLIESGDLKPDSALRKQFEKHANTIALPCYQDNTQALNRLIEEEITAQGLQLDNEARQTLVSLLGEDRSASRGELQKLALYAHGDESISNDQIRSLLGDVSAITNDVIIDDASLGRLEFLQDKLDRLMVTSTAPDMLIWATLRHFQTLHRLKSQCEEKRSSPASVVNGARPPIFFSRRDKVIQMIQKWPLQKLETALKRLSQAFYETRANTDLGPSLAATTLLAICLQARQN